MNITKYYRITIRVKESQQTENGNYLITGINGLGATDNFLLPCSTCQFVAANLDSLKKLINSLIDEQIEYLTIEYK